MSTSDDDPARRLGEARARRWWVAGRRIGSIQRAAAFVDDVGFAFLFPTPRMFAPSLWDAVAGGDAEPFATGMEANEAKVWAWKDDLPRRRLCWYGAFLAGRGSLLSQEIVAAFYPGEGAPDDHESLPLSPAAHHIAEALAAEPLSSAALRALVGDRNVYQRAIGELQRQLLVTNAGVQEQSTGWPSALLDLTCHRFPVGGRQDAALVTARFLDTMLSVVPADLKRAFGWSIPQARQRLDDLVERGTATSSEGRYLPRSDLGS